MLHSQSGTGTRYTTLQSLHSYFDKLFSFFCILFIDARKAYFFFVSCSINHDKTLTIYRQCNAMQILVSQKLTKYSPIFRFSFLHVHIGNDWLFCSTALRRILAIGSWILKALTKNFQSLSMNSFFNLNIMSVYK